MSDYASLKALLLSGPPYTTNTDAQNVTAINAISNGTVYGKLDPSECQDALMWTNTVDWGWMEGVASGALAVANNSGANPVTVSTIGLLRQSCIQFVTRFSALAMMIQLNAARVTQMQAGFDFLVTNNVWSSQGRANMNALITISTPNPSWSVAHGWMAGLSIGEIQAAKVWVP